MKPIRYNRGRYKWRVDVPPKWQGAEKRRSFYFESKEQALALCARVQQWKLNRSGGIQVHNVADSDLWVVPYLKNELGDLGRITAIIDDWKRTSKQLTAKLTVSELIDKFGEYQTAKGLQRNTLAEMMSKLNQFRVAFGNHPAHEFTSTDGDLYLLEKPSGWTRKGHYKWLHQMYDYAVEHGSAVKNPFEGIKSPKAGDSEIETYTPEEFRRLLKTADDQFPELLPWLCLIGFNFLRQCELIPIYTGDPVLQWSDFRPNSKPPLIEIRGEVAKQTSRKKGGWRWPPLQEALVHWLRLDEHPERLEQPGPVIPYKTERRFQYAKTKLFLAAGVETVDNGLRTSCTTYFIAAHPETGRALMAEWAGHTETVSRQFYDANYPPELGNQWLSIRRIPLVVGITSENQQPAADFGPAAGKEIW